MEHCLYHNGNEVVLTLQSTEFLVFICFELSLSDKSSFGNTVALMWLLGLCLMSPKPVFAASKNEEITLSLGRL